MATYAVGTQNPFHLVYAGKDGQGCIVNLDLTNTILVATSEGEAYVGSMNTFIVGPLNYAATTGGLDYWVIAESGQPTVQFMSGVTTWAPSPLQQAQQLVTAGLATEAQQVTGNNIANNSYNSLITGIALPTGAAQETGNLATAANQLVAGIASTPLAIEHGGNLAAAVAQLNGTAAGALVGTIGNTIAKEVSAMIATGSASGTPGGVGGILPVDNQIATGTAVAIPPGSTTLYSGPINAISYKFRVDALITTNTVPFYKISFNWNFSAGDPDSASQEWFCMATNVTPASSNALIGGRGPSETGHVTIIIDNFDPTVNLTVDWEFLGSSRVVTRHDFRSLNNNISGSYTYNPNAVFSVGYPTPDSAPAANFLGGSPFVSVGIGGSFARINALYSGQAQLDVIVTGGGTNAVFLYAVNPGFPVTGALFPIYESSVPSSGFLVAENISLPRNPIIFVYVGGANATTVTYSLVTQEFAS